MLFCFQLHVSPRHLPPLCLSLAWFQCCQARGGDNNVTPCPSPNRDPQMHAGTMTSLNKFSKIGVQVSSPIPFLRFWPRDAGPAGKLHDYTLSKIQVNPSESKSHLFAPKHFLRTINTANPAIFSLLSLFLRVARVCACVASKVIKLLDFALIRSNLLPPFP